MEKKNVWTVYDKKTKIYSAVINGIEFTADTLDDNIIKYAELLAGD